MTRIVSWAATGTCSVGKKIAQCKSTERLLGEKIYMNVASDTIDLQKTQCKSDLYIVFIILMNDT